MAMEKIKTFCKKHKKEIIVGAVTAAGAVAGIVLLKRKPVTVPHVSELMLAENIVEKPWDIPVPADFHVGRWTHFWLDGGTKLPTGIIYGVNINDMGKLGEEILEHCANIQMNEVNPYSTVQMVLEFVNE